MRMTRRVKPPTAAVTMTSTWPWSEAMSDAGRGVAGERKREKKGLRVRTIKTPRTGWQGREQKGDVFIKMSFIVCFPSVQQYTLIWQRLC